MTKRRDMFSNLDIYNGQKKSAHTAMPYAFDVVLFQDVSLDKKMHLFSKLHENPINRLEKFDSDVSAVIHSDSSFVLTSTGTEIGTTMGEAPSTTFQQMYTQPPPSELLSQWEDLFKQSELLTHELSATFSQKRKHDEMDKIDPILNHPSPALTYDIDFTKDANQGCVTLQNPLDTTGDSSPSPDNLFPCSPPPPPPKQQQPQQSQSQNHEFLNTFAESSSSHTINTWSNSSTLAALASSSLSSSPPANIESKDEQKPSKRIKVEENISDELRERRKKQREAAARCRLKKVNALNMANEDLKILREHQSRYLVRFKVLQDRIVADAERIRDQEKEITELRAALLMKRK